MATAPLLHSDAIEAAEARNRILDAADGIVSRLQRLADEAVTARAPTELRWLEDTRAYLGFYDEKTKTELETSKAARSRSFINITQPKTDTIKAKLVDLLFPTDEKNWGINPTPVPELAQQAREAMQAAEARVAEANQLQQLGGAAAMPEVNRLIGEAGTLGERGAQAQAVLDEATKRAEAMERLIDDQLTESDYPKRARDAIEWAAKLGPGIIKGPLIRSRARAGWKRGDADPVSGAAGPWALEHMEDPTIEYAAVNPWDWFPDPSATSMDDCEYVFQRHLPNAEKLKQLTRKMRFDKAAVREILRDTPLSAPRNVEHLAQIRAMSGEMQSITGRYLLWEYHGPLEIGEIATLIRARGDEESAAAADAFEEGAEPQRDARRSGQLEAGVNVQTKSPAATTVPSDDFEAEFNARAAKRAQGKL